MAVQSYWSVFSVAVLLLSSFFANADQVIHVNNTGPTNNDSHCWKTANQEVVCPTLNLALQAISDSSSIKLYAGTYKLENGSETQITNKSNISITGVCENPQQVVVDCQNEAGLAFAYSSNIVLQSFTLSNCSHIQISSSQNVFTTAAENMMYNVAVYIKFCINVKLHMLTVEHSDGVGITMYNTIGNVSISQCNFRDNDLISDGAGGGGLQIELSETLFPSSSKAADYSSGANYSIVNTTFSGNRAYTRQGSNIFKLKKGDVFNLGKGGGFHIILRGEACNNVFLVSNCSVIENKAHNGGGFFISFQDSVANNNVTLSGSTVTSNQNFDVDPWTNKREFDIDGGGGGGKILYQSSTGMSSNIVIILSCYFTSNIGITGGGLWIESVLDLESKNNDFIIKDSKFFFFNQAFLGSALYLSGKFEKHTTCAVLKNVTFQSNTPICRERNSQLYTTLPCAGIVYTINFPLIMQGKICFESNLATALEIHEGSLDITEGSEIIFIENSSLYGGGLALYDCSDVLVYPNTNLTFVNNNAEILGGAIYSDSCSGGVQPVSPSFNCFFQYSDSTLHPEHWNTTFYFRNNTVGQTGHRSINDMYLVSVSSCVWPEVGSSVITRQDYNKTFCWSPWEFSESCNSSFQSSPALLEFRETNNETGFKLFPGESLPLPVVYDGTLRMINSSIISCILSGPGSFSASEFKRCRTKGDSLLLYYKPNAAFSKSEKVLVTVRVEDTIGAAFLPVFEIEYLSCKFPFQFEHSQCVYKGNYYQCDKEICGIGCSVTPKQQYCVTNTSKVGVVIGLCPHSYNGRPSIDLLKNDSVPSSTSCRFHHSGTLCGSCEDSYGVPMNSLHYVCHDCSKSKVPGPILFIALQMFPLTLMIVFIFIFNIKLTSGIMSGFVFYSQIISLNFPVWIYPSWFTFTAAVNDNNSLYFDKTRYATVIYNIFNIDFLVIYNPRETFPICIYNHMDPLGVIAFRYIVPLYPLLIVACLISWLVLYEQGKPCVVRITRPVHRCLARFWSFFKVKPSLISSIASVYILCFTQIAMISVKLLHYASWQSLENENRTGKVFFYNGNLEYFGMPHGVFGVLAIIFLLLFVVLPMMFLLLFPSRLFHRFVLNHIKQPRVKDALVALGDAYTGCFKDGTMDSRDFRYLAGLYLLIRIMIMCFYYIPGQYSGVILYLETATTTFLAGVVMIFRPYKKRTANFTNFLLLALLGFMSTLCLFFGKSGASVDILFLMHLPILVFAVVYVFRRVKQAGSCCFNKHKNKVYFSDSTVNDNSTGTLPDRLNHPEEYSEQYSDSDSDSDDIILTSVNHNSWHTKKSVPLTSSMMSGYGSMRHSSTK